MTTTITGVYKSMETIYNAVDDLLATGIDREKIFADEEHCELKVMVPSVIRPEITEILQRHNPTEMH
jgi:hypothetical protein